MEPAGTGGWKKFDSPGTKRKRRNVKNIRPTQTVVGFITHICIWILTWPQLMEAEKCTACLTVEGLMKGRRL